MKFNKHTPFWLLTIAVFVGLIVPFLIQDGMFMDGLLYTCVAKNLANGIGTFWYPKFSELGFAGSLTFHEHPPLVFWIQALFFKVLGNSIYVERIYSLLTGLITAFLVIKLWDLITKDDKEYRGLSWLPVLMWIIIPVNFMTYRSNMMENTMGIFTLLSIIFALHGLYLGRKVIPLMIFSGVFIFLASFSKGVPGLFPIAIVGIYWIVYRSISIAQLFLYTSILLITPAVIYGILLIDPDAQKSLSFYFYDRLLGRIDSAPTVDNRFFTIGKIFEETIPALAITVIMLAVFRIRSIKMKLDRSKTRKILLLLLIGCSASVPLMLTMVQKGWYITPALPYLSTCLALIIASGVQTLIKDIRTEKKSFRIFSLLSVASVTASIIISFSFYGKIGREKDLLHDLYEVGEIVPENSTISIDASMWNDWFLQCYLIRLFNISVDIATDDRDYYLVEKTIDQNLSQDHRLINMDTKRLDLYELTKESNERGLVN